MDVYKEKIIAFITTHKWTLLPLVLLFLFLIFLSTLLFQPQKEQTQAPSPTPSIFQPVSPTNISEEETSFEETETLTDFESQPGFQKKEAQADGTTTYYFTSDNPNRSNLLILSPNKTIVFERNISSKELPLGSLSVYRRTYGEPERITQGSSVYGQQAIKYIYGSIGLAIIANPQTEEVYEEHFFPPMSVDEYLQRYGNQN